MNIASKFTFNLSPMGEVHLSTQILFRKTFPKCMFPHFCSCLTPWTHGGSHHSVKVKITKTRQIVA
ncbi:hypothetical protein V6Z11_A08G094700 [Gossypium hirsutum]